MGGGLAAGQARARSFNITVPNRIGPFRVTMVADFDNRLSEGPGETNNASAPVDVEFVPADLVARNATVPASAAINDSVTVSWEVANDGAGSAFGCFYTAVRLSADDTLSLDDPTVAQPYACYSSIAPGAASSASAIGRSNDVPSFRTSAGERCTVIRLDGTSNPEVESAAVTRSRASFTAFDARPTMVQDGSPGTTSTSTVTSIASMPMTEADRMEASMGAQLRLARPSASPVYSHPHRIAAVRGKALGRDGRLTASATATATALPTPRAYFRLLFGL